MPRTQTRSRAVRTTEACTESLLRYVSHSIAGRTTIGTYNRPSGEGVSGVTANEEDVSARDLVVLLTTGETEVFPFCFVGQALDPESLPPLPGTCQAWRSDDGHSVSPDTGANTTEKAA